MRLPKLNKIFLYDDYSAKALNIGEIVEYLTDKLAKVEVEIKGNPFNTLSNIAADCARKIAGTNLSSVMEEHDLGRQYEPEEAVVGALEICRNNPNIILHDHWIKISDIKRTANTEHDMGLKPQQVATILHRRGHEISTIDGYPVVRV